MESNNPFPPISNQQELGLNSEVAVVFNVEEKKAVITGTW